MRDKAKHAAYMRQWYAANQERARELLRKSYAKHRDARRERMLRKNSANPDRDRAMATARHNSRLANDPVYAATCRLNGRLGRANKRFGLQPLGKFFRAEIRAFYHACPAGLTVDHIEPVFTKVKGEAIACGLHVPWNLQYLDLQTNQSKGNKNYAAGVLKGSICRRYHVTRNPGSG